jgi:hypothetical protein
LFLIHQCVDGDNFEKGCDCESSKQAGEILEKTYTWVDKTKVMRLQTHKRQLELIQMEEEETIDDFTTRITRLVRMRRNYYGAVCCLKNFVFFNTNI